MTELLPLIDRDGPENNPDTGHYCYGRKWLEENFWTRPKMKKYSKLKIKLLKEKSRKNEVEWVCLQKVYK